jgi:hypothetical protein
MSIALLNAVPFEVTYLDGRKETLKIGELPIRALYEFIEFVRRSQTPELVALCAGKPPEWIDLLKLESYGALAEQCIKLNFQRAMTLVEKDPVVASAMAQILIGTINFATSMGTIDPKTLEALKALDAAATRKSEKTSSPAPAESAPSSSAPSPAPAASASPAATGSG